MLVSIEYEHHINLLLLPSFNKLFNIHWVLLQKNVKLPVKPAQKGILIARRLVKEVCKTITN